MQRSSDIDFQKMPNFNRKNIDSEEEMLIEYVLDKFVVKFRSMIRVKCLTVYKHINID